MSAITVERDAVRKSIVLCNETIRQYKKTINKLQISYRDAGIKWRDKKYVQLGNVVGECTVALNSPIRELEECVEKLEMLLHAIEKYEDENL